MVGPLGETWRQSISSISLMRMNSGINIDGILPSVRVPTLILHLTEDPTVSIQAGR